MVFNRHLKALNLCNHSDTIACVLYELLVCLELFNVFFQQENRFRYKFFDIFQFSRSCSASAMRLTTWLFYHRSGFLSSFIFSRLLNVLNLDASKFLGADRNFSASIGSFQRLRAEVSEVILCLSAWRSSIIPHLPPSVNTFRQVFSVFFAIHSGVRKSTRFECPPLRAGHLQRQLLFSLQPAQNGPFTSLAVMTGSRCGPVPDFSI